MQPILVLGGAPTVSLNVDLAAALKTVTSVNVFNEHIEVDEGSTVCAD